MFRLTIALLILSALSACTPHAVKQTLESPPPGVPPAALIKDVPFFPQSENYCGPSTLAMALGYYGVDMVPEALAKLVYTPGLKGSLQVEMASALRRQGFLAYRLPNNLNALLEELASGHPVIVLQNLGLKISPRWHYAVVLGYDLAAADMILHSGKQRFYRLSFKTFAYTWGRSNNWALVPLPAGELPKQDDPNGFFIAAAELEKTSTNQTDAKLIYQSALARWPSKLAFSIALSNAYYAEGKYREAAEVLIASLTHNPRAALLYNNLAYSLLAQRCDASALESIRCAVGIDDEVEFEVSFREISAEVNLGMDGSIQGDNCPVVVCPIR